MRSTTAVAAFLGTSIIGFVPTAFAEGPKVSFDKAIDYSKVPGVYARSSDPQDAKCPLKFTLRVNGSYKRVSSTGAVERGTATKLARKDDRSGQPFQAKSSGGRKYKFNVVPSNNGVPGALIGFEVKDGNGLICGYVRDDPASRALLPALPGAQAGRVNFKLKTDIDQLFGAYIEIEPKAGVTTDKACGHTIEIGRNGAYVRFLSDGKRENGTYKMLKRTDDNPGQPLALTSAKGRKYKVGILPTNEGNPGMIMLVEKKGGQTAMCGFGRVARF